MPQVRESLGIADGGPPSLTFSIKSKKGLNVSWSLGLLFAAIYVISLVATGLLVYNFAACPHLNLSKDFSEILCQNTSWTDDSHPSQAEQTPATTTVIPSEETHKVSDLRLPRSVKPIKYNISLLPFIFEGNFTFQGKVDIVVEAVVSTNNITLHATDLLISKTEVKALNESDLNQQNLKIIGQYNNTEKQFHIIHLKHDLVVGKYYHINMEFSGKINDDLHGFYRSSYTDGNETRWLGASQFQPTDARRAFPCFDEPAMKARFIMNLAHPKNLTAISNMNPTGVQDPVEGLPDYVWDHFHESLPMSTYLVAFIISDFANKSEGNFTVWARKDAIESANYALDIGPKILKYLEKFYQIHYPLPKVDMVALPDFNAGAMENWGLITFRETTMLYDEGVSAKINKPRVATIVAHELAHQWFGNLVTPSWWSDLWLNEGFASYVEYVGVDAVETTWKSMDQFVLHEIQNVFSLDALSSSHQISVEVDNPDEINDIFDRISYGKGAAIIRMMSHFLTSEVFNKGITNYLNNKMYESADQNDLWNALTEQARKDGIFDESMSIHVIMDTWTLQTGFPVVNVLRDYKTDTMSLQQERFMLITNESSKNTVNLTDQHSPLWWIPITYTSKTQSDFINTKPVEWMRGDKNLTLTNTNVSYDDWVIFNVRQTGFYRVNYDKRNWQMIISYLNNKSDFKKISIPNRAQILDDALNLALAGKLSYGIALHITKYLTHEREFVPWKAGIMGLGYIDSMMSKSPHYLEYKKYILNLIKGIYNEVGFVDKQDDPMLTIYKRIDIINIACLMEHEDCLRQAVTQFHNWMLVPNPDIYNPISPNLRNTVYCTALRVGGATEWHFMHARFLKARSVSEKDLLMTALGCTRLPWLLIRYLDLACRNDTGIRKQDVYRVFGAVSNSAIGQPIAFSFIRQNWQKLKNYLGSPSTLNSIVKYSTRKLNAQHELDQLKKFSEDRKGELGRTIDQAIEKTEANIIWMRRNYDTIVKWLNGNLS